MPVHTPKYADRAADQDAFYEEFHCMSSVVEVFRFLVAETTKSARSALCGSRNSSYLDALTYIIEVENQRRQRINSQKGKQEQLQLIDHSQNYDIKTLKEMMCQLPSLPSPLPHDFSRVDFVLAHLDNLKGTTYGKWATAVEQMIAHFYDPVNNTLYVPYSTTNADQKLCCKTASGCRDYWDDDKHATSNGVMNAGKKQVLSFLGFVGDLDRHRTAQNVAALKEFKLLHGHCHPTPIENSKLAMFLNNLRAHGVQADIENELSEIGWRKNQDPVVERARVETAENDKQMIAIYEEFQKRNGRHVPWPGRVGKVEIKRLYVWVESVRARLKEDQNQLDAEVLQRLVKLGFLTETIKHYGPFRSEYRHYEFVDQWWKELGFFPPGKVNWAGIDEVDSNQDKRRADRLHIGKFKNGRRVIIDEFDEAGHFDRSKESEQKKVYNQCTNYLQDEELNVRDIHIIRINGGYDPFPCTNQAKEHAVLIHNIMNRPIPEKPCVTVHMLDFDEQHIHVKAYQNRIIPQCDKFERATTEEEWDSSPLYDKVILYWTPEAESDAAGE